MDPRTSPAPDALPGELARHHLASLPVLVLHAHSSCNCRCVMCDIWKTKDGRAMTPSDLAPHVASMRALSVRWVIFTGGEPLLNAALPLLCSMLRRENIRLTLLTTGLLLGKYAQEVASSFDDVIVSLDGPESVHDAIRNVEGAYALMHLGIGAVRRFRPSLPMAARTTVQKANYRHLRDTVESSQMLGLNGISFLAADVTSSAFNRPLAWSQDRQSDVALALQDMPRLEVEIETLIKENAADIESGFIAESPAKLRRLVRHFRAHLGLDKPESPRCNAPWTSAVIETDGSMRPCFFHAPIGNVRQASLEDVINGEMALRFRSALDIATNPICNRCVCALNYAAEG